MTFYIGKLRLVDKVDAHQDCLRVKPEAGRRERPWIASMPMRTLAALTQDGLLLTWPWQSLGICQLQSHVVAAARAICKARR